MTTKTTTTVAMDFGRVAVDQAIVLYLFGTPGQDRFGFMWNDLIQGALGAVVLVDSRRIEDSFPALDYFEGRGVRIVVAIDKFGGNMFHSVDEVREALSINPNVPVITTDARGRSAVKDGAEPSRCRVQPRTRTTAAVDGRSPELQLLPGDGHVADQLPRQSAAAARVGAPRRVPGAGCAPRRWRRGS